MRAHRVETASGVAIRGIRLAGPCQRLSRCSGSPSICSGRQRARRSTWWTSVVSAGQRGAGSDRRWTGTRFLSGLAHDCRSGPVRTTDPPDASNAHSAARRRSGAAARRSRKVHEEAGSVPIGNQADHSRTPVVGASRCQGAVPDGPRKAIDGVHRGCRGYPRVPTQLVH